MMMFGAGTQNNLSAFTISLVGPGGPGGCQAPSGAGVYVQFYNDDIDIPFPNLTDGNWHYVAVTVSESGTLVNVVIDGQQPAGYTWNNVCYASTPMSQTANSPSGFQMPYAVDTATAPFTYGAAGWASGFGGSLDLAAIYPTALSPSVLESHYEAGTEPSPVVTGVSPLSGQGGTEVTITGSNFSNPTVRFAQTPVSTILSSSESQLVVLAPSGSGTVDVTVTTAAGTSPIGNTDKFTYATPLPPHAKPRVQAFAPALKGRTGATLKAEVVPEGLATTAYYEYGLDARYQASGIALHNLSTPKTQLGSGFATVPMTATLSGLLPNAVYRVRLVAVNAAGTTAGPDQSFRTPPGPQAAPPSLGRENFRASSGTIFVFQRGNLVPLTENTQLPPGTVIDARHGSLTLSASSGTKGKKYTGTSVAACSRSARRSPDLTAASRQSRSRT